LSTYLQAVADRLWEQVPSDLDPPTVKIVMDAHAQAYAYPNGVCFLTTGILNQMENEDQLAMIIAHEMVHYFRQHTMALYDQFHNPVPDPAARDTHQKQVMGGRTIAQIVAAAEYQADREGLAILDAAGYCQPEVLTLISNLIACMQDQGNVKTARQLQNRLAVMTSLINPPREITACASATDGASEAFLNRIAPALIAHTQVTLRRGDWHEADRSVSKYLRLNPNDARAYYLRGEIVRHRNDSNGQQQCIGWYQKALKINPAFPLALRAAGEWYYKAGQYQAAKPYFEDFLSLAPRDDACEYIKGYLRQCQK
jgi:predicted Zn-dependent protease